MSQPVLIVMLAVTVGLVTLLSVWLAVRRRRETLGQIARRAGGTVSREPLGRSTPITGAWDEFQYQIRHLPSAKNQPASITATLSLPPLPGWKIRRERAFDRLGKSLGLAEEWQTGDERFDAAFYLEADPADSMQRLLASPAVRQTVQEAFALPWRVASLTLDRKGLSLLITPVTRGKLEGFQPAEVLRPLASLAREITGQYPPGTAFQRLEEARSARRGFQLRLAPLYTLVGLGFIGGLVAMGIGFSRYEPLHASFVWKSLQTTLPLGLLFLGVAFGLLRGRSTSHRHFFALAFLSLIVIPLAGIGT
ncbi:MAG TPA: hypothetical protein PKK12_02875, partial [Candidatus Aminicenantes bacterium]|nr:hypothetical protein [Candidatus Aminicenantes bacterium]